MTKTRLRAIAPWAALSVLFAMTSIVVGLLVFANDSQRITIGAHAATVSPTFDRHATLDLGAVLPRLRMPSNEPLGLGVNIDVQETNASNLTDLINRDALIAAQPEGEIARIQQAVQQMAVDDALAGAGTGFLVVVLVATLWTMIGVRRRRELWHLVHRHERRVEHRAVVVLVALLITVASIIGPGRIRGVEVPPTQWTPLATLLPELDLDQQLQGVEVAAGFSTTGGVGFVKTAVETYQRSTQFYGRLKDKVGGVKGQIHQPGKDETVAIQLNDRHDNIGMDPVAAAVAKAAGAKLMIDAGDDTSGGQSWEAFSINSLRQHFKDFTVVAVAGNHDAGGYIVDQMRKSGFTVLDSKPVEVEGIRFLGDSDPTKTGLGTGNIPGKETVEQQSKRLADIACAQPPDKRISTFVVHDPVSLADTAARGCATLLLSGHLHHQVGPETKVVDGRAVTTYTNGTTGGAAYSFALGYALRLPGEMTLITYLKGEPVGLQTVTATTGGELTVGAYTPLSS
ncbi:metallophosphoesterase family protein [Kribbella sp.]|uniref:metallophosphoesterase family protein n=1 Tax=Kribbella sp. TaxID=1871183 RepID=UPI002D7526C8|nr:metallophosphoesterase [Kribbella sp.]HZX05532.1 metallophosphoesterase [Kribbella sp.]